MKLLVLLTIFLINIDALSRESAIEAVDKENLRVCADPSNLPFSNENGEGYENEIAELLGKKLNIPVICFPRGIKDYKTFCEVVKPNAICIDYDVSPEEINRDIKIPVQGGLDPKILLTDKDNLKKEAKRYLDIFKDHPYIFNLGHGVLPETDPNMMDYLVKFVKDY